MILSIGYFTLSASLGFILGASNSPVAGVFITAFFGLLGTVIGAQYLFDKSKSLPINNISVGVGLIVVSVGLVGGIFSGEHYRTGGSNDTTKTKTLPWLGLESPKNTYEALDWLQVQEKLSKLGYSDEQIKEIYSIRVNERKDLELKAQEEVSDSYSSVTVYEPGMPFHASIPETQDASSGGSRGLASVK